MPLLLSDREATISVRPHTLSHYLRALYLPIVSDRQNHGTWQENGALDGAPRAHRIARELLEGHERPPLDPEVDEEC
jgi:trimethylamine--corrinoid protein Co-methyltransferase